MVDLPGKMGSPTTAGRLADLMAATQRGEWYDALCPSHDDHHPSLSFTEGHGGLFVLCRAGCTADEVATALREQFPGLHLTFARRQHGTKRKVIASYRYKDEAGHLLYEVVRFDPKGFTQRRPDGKRGWIPSLKGVRRVLYRLPELAAKRPKLVWVVEGEKDVDRLWALNLPATTNSGGAGNWTDEHTEQLVSQGITSVILVPDLDEAGERHARTVTASCLRAGLTVATIHLPGLPKRVTSPTGLPLAIPRKN